MGLSNFLHLQISVQINLESFAYFRLHYHSIFYVFSLSTSSLQPLSTFSFLYQISHSTFSLIFCQLFSLLTFLFDFLYNFTFPPPTPIKFFSLSLTTFHVFPFHFVFILSRYFCLYFHKLLCPSTFTQYLLSLLSLSSFISCFISTFSLPLFLSLYFLTLLCVYK